MFDVTSPKGVLLFREASKTIVTYGQCALTMNNMAEEEVYERKLVSKELHVYRSSTPLYM